MQLKSRGTVLSGMQKARDRFSLPPNSATKSGKRHGVHYIKLFPIDSKYIQKYRIDNNVYMQ